MWWLAFWIAIMAIGALGVVASANSIRFGRFVARDLPRTFSAERYRDLGGGKSILTPFSGLSSDYRQVDGLLVPHQMIASWHVDGRPIPYVRFQVERLQFDAKSPF